MKLKESLGLKIAAVILSYVTVLSLILSLAFTGVMVVYKFYFSSEELVKDEILTDMAEGEAYYIERLITTGTDLTKYYKDKNVFFRLTDADSGKVIETNYSNEPYSVTASSEYCYYEDYYAEDEYGNGYWEQRPVSTTLIEVFVAKNMTKSDMFSVMEKIIEIGYGLRYAMVFIVLISLTLSIVLLCYLYCAAGHRAGGDIKCNNLDMLPFDILSAIVLVIALFSIIAVGEWYYDRASLFVLVFIIGTIDYFVALGYTMSFATRIKTRTLFKNTVIFRIFKFLGKHLNRFFGWVKYVFSNIPLVYKTVIIIAGLLLAEVITFIIVFNIYWAFGFGGLFFAMAVINVVVFSAVLYISVVLQKIKTGGERIAKGDLEYKIDTKYMFGDFKDFSISLNNINEGLQSAVNEKMKSERFKTELITNVSHDIKTPLTSIINYVDLIKKENPENETISRYIDVLDRQSGRLKKLVEDLVEASKASTGNLAVNLSECDVGVLLSQALGEFEEKLNKANIKPVLNIPEESIKIMADGRHLWRVFDNLMNNICKYALCGTRAYLDVVENDGKAIITFRNISKYELNVSADELMERFVRGDSSRNTEGSGLGLSIAKSLVELQGGSMSITVDGDLFKGIISFDTLK